MFRFGCAVWRLQLGFRRIQHVDISQPIRDPLLEYTPRGWTELRLELDAATEPRRLPGPPITSTAKARTTRHPGQYRKLKPVMLTASAEQNEPPQPPQYLRGSVRSYQRPVLLATKAFPGSYPKGRKTCRNQPCTWEPHSPTRFWHLLRAATIGTW